jgi:glycine/D-amino acid oxidase-like deaminating enzyme
MPDDEGIVAGALGLDRREYRLLRATEFGDRVEVPIRRRDAMDLNRDTGRGQRLQPIAQAVYIGCLLSVVLAGGVWSRLFCGNLDLRLPQLKVMSSVMRTEKFDAGLETSCSGFGFGVRKRLDGGYNVASWSGNVVDIVPDTFRFFADFLPALRLQWRGMRLRIGGKFLEDWQVPRRWALDAASPFERVRTLDPEPYQPILDQARTHLTAAFPEFRNMKVAESWGGVIDVTPDAVPVISAVDTLPGFFIATGFTGHGFGIGPGAGLLMAELVTGETPVVDPTPFRYSRFTDGSRPMPSPLA